MGVDIDHETRIRLVNIESCKNENRRHVGTIRDPIIKVRTTTHVIPMVKMVKIEGNKIDNILIFEL